MEQSLSDQPEAGTVRDRVDGAVSFLRARIGVQPRVGIILGSGLGGLQDDVVDALHLRFTEIPGFPRVTVIGHDGVLTAGGLAGVPVVLMRGRFHRYEGHDAATVALPARVLVRLGVRELIVTNAAGGINRTFRPGDLMLIDDHINLMWVNPLVGPVQEGELRFPDMSAPYDPALQRYAERVALREGVRLTRGVYCGLLGPSYETPAEVRMLARLGADAVGMSTVPEVIVARAAGVRTMGISLITNVAAGLSQAPLEHDDVVRAGEQARAAFRRLLLGVLGELTTGD